MSNCVSGKDLTFKYLALSAKSTDIPWSFSDQLCCWGIPRLQLFSLRGQFQGIILSEVVRKATWN